MSVGYASGENRIGKAFIEALKSPLLNNTEIEKARRMLYIIYSSDEHQVAISELNEIRFFMNELAEDIEVLWGVYRDNSLSEQVKVTLIATDFAEQNINQSSMNNPTHMNELQNNLMEMYYSEHNHKVKKETEEVDTIEATKDGKEVKTESSTKTCHQKIKFIDRFLKKLGEVVDALD